MSSAVVQVMLHFTTGEYLSGVIVEHVNNERTTPREIIAAISSAIQWIEVFVESIHLDEGHTRILECKGREGVRNK